MAKSEPTRRIPGVTDERIIRGFFGRRARPYDYTVTAEDFDRDDNEGPGHYVGITVPASLADRWDAGIIACRRRKVGSRSPEGLLIRYRIMAADDTADLPPALAAYLAAKEAAAEKQAAAKRKAAAEKQEVDRLLDGLRATSVEPAPGDCTFGGPGMQRLDRGDTTYLEGRTADGRRIVREDCRGYDDCRTYYHAPHDIAVAWAMAYAARQGITPERAHECIGRWLSR